MSCLSVRRLEFSIVQIDYSQSAFDAHQLRSFGDQIVYNFQLSYELIRKPSIAITHAHAKEKFTILRAYPLTERVSFGDKAFNRTYGAQSPALNVRVGNLSIGLIT